jgi:hypothetical protein
MILDVRAQYYETQTTASQARSEAQQMAAGRGKGKYYREV